MDTAPAAPSPSLATLRTIPALLERLVGMVAALRSRPDGPAATAWEAPLPLHADAFDDANALFMHLCREAEYEAAWVHGGKPTLRAWRDIHGRPIGLPAGITPKQARDEAQAIVEWLDDHHALLGEYALDGLAYEVRTIAAKYPYRDRPSVSKTAVCPDCRGSLLVQPPRFPGDPQRIACQSCTAVLTEAEYAQVEHQYAGILAAEKAAARSNAVRSRLAAKYGSATA